MKNIIKNSILKISFVCALTAMVILALMIEKMFTPYIIIPCVLCGLYVVALTIIIRKRWIFVN